MSLKIITCHLNSTEPKKTWRYNSENSWWLLYYTRPGRWYHESWGHQGNEYIIHLHKKAANWWYSKFFNCWLPNFSDPQTSSVEIERVCNKADEKVLETAALGIRLTTGGPEQLVVLAVLKPGCSNCEADLLRRKFQKAIEKDLNPLFKVLCIVKLKKFELGYK